MRGAAPTLCGLFVAVLGLVGEVGGRASASIQGSLAPRGTVLHAHNCYPEGGQFGDRLARALGTGVRPIAIEQDLVWAPASTGGGGRPVVSHGAPLDGREPSLEDHFFRAVGPILDEALRTNRRETWPVLILHLDFKTNEPEHHRAVWDLLGRHERWLTTAERTADALTRASLTPGPLLVLTENGPGQSRVFHDEVPVGGRLRLFGVVPSGLPDLAELPRDERAARQVTATPEILMPAPATNYQRWTNHSWAVVERGGQAEAGAWTGEDERRLTAIVARARTMGLWIRFYALNGHTSGEGDGWSESYNFGSRDAVEQRWDAAIRSGVDLVATDQYERFAERLRRLRP